MQYNDDSRLDTSERAGRAAWRWQSAAAAVAGWPCGGGGLGVVGAARRRAHQRARRGRRERRGGDSRPARAERPAGHRGQQRGRSRTARPARTPTTSSSARSSPTSTPSRRTGLPSCPRLGARRTPGADGLVQRAGVDRLRCGHERLGAVLLPRRQAGLHRPDLLRRPEDAVRSRGRAVRRRLRARARVRPPRAGSARHRGQGQARRDRADVGFGPPGTAGRLLRRRVGQARHRARSRTASRPWSPDITQDDINRALDAAARIGDDYIQQNLGNGQVNQNAFTHGSSAQRQKWFTHRLPDRRPEPLRHVQRHRPRLMRRSGARGGSHPPVRKMLSDRRG